MGRRNQLAATQVAFNPARIRGLELWLDGADAATLFQDTAATTPATAVTNPVGYWQDKSGFGRHATQGTAANRPVVATHAASNKTVLSFDGSNDFLSSGAVESWQFLHNGTPHNMFVVYSTTAVSTCAVMGTGTTGTSTGFDILANTLYFRHGVINASSGPNVLDNGVTLSATNTSMRVLRVRGFAASTPAADRSTMFADGATQYKNNTTTGTAATTVSTHPLIIGARGGPNAPLTGTIAEVLVFNSMASETDMQQVEQYLLRKWAVTAPTAVTSPLDISNCAIWLDSSDTSTLYTTDAGPVTPVTAPTDIAGCVGWWDASDASSITQSGGLISQWNDKSGNGKHATASGVNRPTYTGTRNGRTVVTFDGTGNRMNTTLVDSATQTILFVAKATATSAPGTRRVVSYQADRGFYASTGWNWFSPNAGTGAPPTDYNVVSGVITNDTSMMVYGNGVTVSAAIDPFNAGSTTFVLGGENASTVFNLFQGEIAEVVVFNSALSTANRARVERYLALKWGVPGVHERVNVPGQPVGYWANKAGNDFNFYAALISSLTSRAALSTQRMNNISPVEFNGISSTLECSSFNFSGNEISAFCVYQVDNQSTSPIVWEYAYTGSATNQQGITGFVNAAGIAALASGAVVSRIEAIRSLTSYQGGGSNSTLATRRATISSLIGTFSTTPTRSVWMNSVSGAIATANRYNGNIWPLFTLGTRRSSATADAATLFLGGRIAEFIVYSRAVTDAERARIERYLNNKWGVGLIPPVASHPDAQDWVNRVYLNGGTCSQNTVDAVSSFCRDIDAAGLRSKFYRLNLFCGNELLACRTPLYRGPSVSERHGFDLDVLTVGSGGSAGNIFTNTDYTEYGINGGLAGRLQTTTNGNAGPGLRTGIVPAYISAFYGPARPAGMSYNYSSLHLAAYIRKLRNQTVSTGVLLGAYGGLSANFGVAGHGMTLSVNQPSWYVGPFQASVSGAYDNIDRGLYLANVQSTSEIVGSDYVSELTLYAGSLRYITGRVGYGPFLHPNTDFGVFGECRTAIAYNQNDNSPFRAEQTMQGYSIGLGMTETEAQAYNQIMNRFQNRLGRGLPESAPAPVFAGITHADTLNWISRVYAHGGSVSSTTATAVQTFCNAIDAAGIRNRFYRLNLFCGSDFYAAVVPLYRGPSVSGTQYGNTVDTWENFTPSDYTETGAAFGGFKGDGVSKCLYTGVYDDLGADVHLSAYINQHTALLNKQDIGNVNSDANANRLSLYSAVTGAYWFNNSSSAQAAQINIADRIPGFYVGSGSATNATIYRGLSNGSIGQASAAMTQRATTRQTIRVFAGQNSAGSITAASDSRMSGYSVGLSLTAQQVTSFNSAMQTFQAALARNANASTDPVFASITNPDAKLWIDNVYANNGTVSLSTATAVNTFCNAIDAAGIRDRFIRLNLFCGGNLSACLVPLYRGQSSGGTQVGNATDTNSNFVSGDYVETGSAGGLLGDGINKQLSIGLTPNDVGSSTGHLSAYIPTVTGTTAARVMGAGTVSPTSMYSLERASGANGIQGSYGDSGRAVGSGTQSGHYLITRTSSTSGLTMYVNGSASATDNLTANVRTSAFDIRIFCYNFSNSIQNFWPSRILSYSVGASMTASQASAYYTALQTFQTALGRNV